MNSNETSNGAVLPTSILDMKFNSMKMNKAMKDIPDDEEAEEFERNNKRRRQIIEQRLLSSSQSGINEDISE